MIVSNIEELDKLAQMIQSTLFIARAENKNIRLNREELSVYEIINEVYELFATSAEEKHITLYCPPSPVIISADYLLLSRVFINLISNAIKYSRDKTQVTTQITTQSEHVIIRMINHGEPMLDHPEIFTRFWRGDNARTTEGTGLGLSIVKAIVELHNGEVSFAHQAGTSTLTLRFPISH